MKQQKIVQFVGRHEWLTLASVLAAFAGIAAGNMARWSIWFDEAFSAYIVRFDFAKIAYFTANDVHPPFYYWLLKLWTIVFGHSVVSLRSLSLLFALIALVGVYVLVRRLTESKWYSLVATLAAAFTPVLVRLSNEARMYTLVLAIVVWATYFLLRAQEENRRCWWGAYSLLVMLGMLTHYFAALAWLAHWAWRYFEVRSGRIKKFFSKPWVVTFAIAISLYAWWIPMAVKQFATVQASGFWIPDVTAVTPVNYATDTLAYREDDETTGWWALLLLATITLVSWCLWRSLPKMQRKFRRSDLSMLVSLVCVPLLLLAIGSLPPLKPSFISRYILFAQVAALVLISLATAWTYKRYKRLAMFTAALIAVCCITGIYHVYSIGNYNKVAKLSTRTGDVMSEISRVGQSNQPVLAASQWLYYEMAVYNTPSHPVYYNAEGMTYYYGSERMLEEDDTGKIRSLSEFARKHRYVWYLTDSKDNLQPPVASWKLTKSIQVYDPIGKESRYKAGLYDTQG